MSAISCQFITFFLTSAALYVFWSHSVQLFTDIHFQTISKWKGSYLNLLKSFKEAVEKVLMFRVSAELVPKQKK